MTDAADDSARAAGAHRPDATVTAAPEGMRGALWLLRDMRRATGTRLWWALGFLVLGSLSEGLSVVMLLPILQLANADSGSAALDLAGRSIAGLPLPQVSLGLEALLAALVVLVILQALFNRAKAVYLSDVLQDFSISTRAGLFDSIARARWDALVRLPRADLEQALTGEIERIQLASFMTLGIVQTLIGTLIYLGISMALSGPMTLFALGFGILALALMRPFRRMSAEFGNRIQHSRGQQFRIVSEFLSGLRTARSMNAEPQHVAAFNGALNRMKGDAGMHARQSSIGSGLFSVAMTLGATLFVWFSLRVAQMPITEVIVLLLILMRLSPRVMALQSQAQQLLIDLPACRRLAELRQRLDARSEDSAAFAAEPIAAPRRSLQLDKVTYRYPYEAADGTETADASGRAALDDCDITIEIGKVTAIIGPSGSGKSTLADILLGLIRPHDGEFRVDGAALSTAQLRGWREHLAYVPQDPVLMHDTIRANLLAGAAHATDADIQLALTRAAAAEFVARLPRGLDTTVGDRGALLSGGERQRLALARAFLRQPRVLILDEATSALDWQSQTQIAKSLAELPEDVTVVMIAHRPSLVRYADMVYAMDHGRVSETGSPDLLLTDPQSHLSQMMASETHAI